MIAHLGGRCARCGETDACVLDIHHRNGGGNHERRTTQQRTYYRSIVRGERDGEFELLCANDHRREGCPG